MNSQSDKSVEVKEGTKRKEDDSDEVLDQPVALPSNDTVSRVKPFYEGINYAQLPEYTQENKCMYTLYSDTEFTKMRGLLTEEEKQLSKRYIIECGNNEDEFLRGNLTKKAVSSLGIY